PMEQKRSEGEPGLLPVPAAPVDIEPHAPVPATWLEGFVDSADARRLAELEADLEMLDRIMWAGFEGHEWQIFAERLVRYAFQVLLAWTRSGVIFARCKATGYGGLPKHPRSQQRDEATDLALETAA